MLTNKFYGFAAVMASILLMQIGCSNNSSSNSSNGSDSTSNTSQAAVGEMNNQAQASESSTTVGLLDLEGLNEDANPIHSLASTTCSYSSVRGSCSNSTDTINWNSCTVDSNNSSSAAATMTGSWTETFTGTSATSCTVPVVSGETVVRATASSVITGPLGASVTTDTNGGTAWDGTVIPNTGTSIVNNSGTRTITVSGTHKVGKGIAGGTLYDHFITSPTAITMTGTRAAGTRAITGGTMKVYHNLAKYSATLAFNSVAWNSSSCCYPTTGTITGTLTGSVTGSTTLTFTSTCGSATYQDAGSSTASTITLTQCM